MEKTVNNLKFDRAIARLSKEEFADLIGPYYVKEVVERRKNPETGEWEKVLDENGKPNVLNRFCIRLKGPRNADGTVPPSSQGNQVAFVATNLDPNGEMEFAAFFDEHDDPQWILMNKTAGFNDEALFVVD